MPDFLRITFSYWFDIYPKETESSLRRLKIASFLLNSNLERLEGFYKFFQRLLLSDLYPGSMTGEKQTTGQHLPNQDVTTAAHDDTKL